MKVILFGATGMVGQGVLRECLHDDRVESVLVIGRRATGVTDPKLRELILPDLFDVTAANDALNGYDACFFCLGVSAAGMSEQEYTRVTYDLTMAWAHTLAHVNPNLTFIYVSGAGTGGKAMWARVKGRTEAALLELFPRAHMIRLAMLRARHGERSQTKWTRISYAIFRPVLPLLHAIAPSAVITTEELGQAMIEAALQGAPKRVLDTRDLRALAVRSQAQ